MIMFKVPNKFFYSSEAYYDKNGFTNPYLAKQFEKKSLQIKLKC